MDSLLGSIVLQVNETVEEAVKEPTAAGSIKFKSTPEGMMTAYVSLVIMALIPIVVGAYKSVTHHHTQKEKSRVSFQEIRQTRRRLPVNGKTRKVVDEKHKNSL